MRAQAKLSTMKADMPDIHSGGVAVGDDKSESYTMGNSEPSSS